MAINPQTFWLVTEFTKRELAGRYRGTLLGILWPVCYGLLFLGMFSFVFGMLLKVRWSGSEDAGAIMIFCGLVPYLFLAETLGRSPGILLGASSLVKRALFPVAVLPVVAVNGAFIILLVNITLLFAFSFFLGKSQLITALIFLSLTIPLYALGLGLAWLLSAATVFFRDIMQISPIIAQVLMFMAPVFYPMTIVPSQFETVFAFNPLTYYAEAFRAGLVGAFDASQWLFMTVASFLFAAFAAWFFARLRPAFGDVL